MPKNKISLFELNQGIKNILKETFSERVWLIAEISELKVNANGHCYLELIEKDKESEELLAKARATIWAYTFKMLKPYFETTSGLELTVGLNVLLNVSVEFHEYYGYSLNIHDIDPAYTLGDLAQKRIETINRLKEEGVIDMNKSLELPLVPQRIAIISSDTAAGYKDFIHQLENNEYNYKFNCKLFPAIMQGPNAEDSIIKQLDKIYEYEKSFDVVIIIRGGGAQSDLNCFDSYWLSYHVAQFSLPVITGIGHEKDESILDIVANVKLKTPTAVAEFLISRLVNFESNLIMLQKELKEVAQDILNEKKSHLTNLNKSFVPLLHKIISKEQLHLNDIIHKYKNSTNQFFSEIYQKLQSYLLKLDYVSGNFISIELQNNNRQKEELNRLLSECFLRQNEKLSFLNKEIKYLDPINILKRGYSITSINSSVLKNHKDLKKGDIVETKLFKGGFKSIVNVVE